VAVIAAPTNFSVVRALRELPNRSRVGVMAVNRVNARDGGEYNRTYAVDGRWGVGEEWTFDGYAARTETPGTAPGDYAFGAGASLTSRDWRAGANVREVGAGFDPGAGFLPRSDYRYVSARLQRNYRFPSVPWFRELRPHVMYNEFFGLDGFTETRLVHIDSHFEFANGAFFQLPGFNLTREGLREPFEISPGVVVPAGTYDNPEWGFEYNTDLSAPVSLDGRITIGGFYSGRRAGTGSTLNVRAGETVAASLRVDYFDVRLPEGDFETLLLRLRAAYSFTPRLYAQALLQYNDMSRSFSSNLRFGWLNTAGTGLFIVVNDLENTGDFERTQLPRGPVERVVLVKFTRQFDLR
jgi:hypothetical protein